MATKSDNVEKAKAWFDVIWNRKQIERLDEFAGEGSIAHLEEGDFKTKDVFEAMHEHFVQTFPDVRVEIEDTLADGDNVVVRWKSTATHTGHGYGLAPTQKAVTARGMTWMRFEGGKIAEGWDCWNLGGMLEKLRQ